MSYESQIDIAFKVEQDNFMKIGELTYTAAKAKKLCLQRQTLEDQTSPLPKVINM